MSTIVAESALARIISAVWTLMHHLAPHASCARMELPVAESLERRVINIPSSPQLAIEGTR